jgi:uncharacterized protein YjbI with pentapeptide repeats
LEDTDRDLTPAHLIQADLQGLNLSRANLSYANASLANLTGSDLRKADLSWADLTDAKLISTNLSEADLHEVNLRGADLSEANLSGANLAGADLTDASLAGANFMMANLIGTDFSRANLSGTNFYEADLSSASLIRANLTEANLSGAVLTLAVFFRADLQKADIHKALLEETVWANVNLSEVKGLETCWHFGPSVLDYQTLAKSGPLPLAFLRGCGLLDWQIEATKLNFENLSNHEVDDIVYKIATLRYGQPIQFYSVFISYSTKDQEFAERLHADLQNKGVRCWFAPHQIQGGKKIHEQIDEAIRLYDRLLLILSRDSMESEWVKTEIAKARKRETREKRRMLFPVRLVKFETLRDWECFDADTGKDSAQEIREYFVPDFSKWKDHDSYQKAFDRLLKDLKAEAERSDTATGRAD